MKGNTDIVHMMFSSNIGSQTITEKNIILSEKENFDFVRKRTNFTLLQFIHI